MRQGGIYLLTLNVLGGYIDLTGFGGPSIIQFHRGDIAQLGERCVRIAEVGGSNPPISTKIVPL